METATAYRFANDWINAWNKHDIAAILAHYDEDIQFYSPLIKLLQFSETGVITGKADLKKYFTVGLSKYPDLHFQFHSLFTGVNTVLICYTSVNQRMAAELFELNEEGKAVRVYCNYAANTIT